MKHPSTKTLYPLLFGATLVLSACQTDAPAGPSPADVSASSGSPEAPLQKAVQTLDLSASANFGIVDEYGYDGKGGWFDQGPDNDLSGLPTGNVTLAGIPFEIADQNANDGKSAILLKGSAAMDFPRSVSVSVGGSNASGYLYLLHGAGWVPSNGTTIGRVTVIYTDGSQTTQMLRAGEEIADWYDAATLSNGALAWTKPCRSGYHGLYVSQLRTKAQPVSALVFSSEGNAVWGVVAATLSNTPLDIPVAAPVTIEAGAEWVPLKASLDVDRGSALDMSWLHDGPAGKYGPITVRDGHFYFEKAPDRRVRFYGTNLCYSANFPTHAEADKLAARLAAMGYNVVRFHHIDSMLTEKGKDSVTLDPERLDRMEYLMAQCEKNGMYLITDLFSYREIREWEIPEIKGKVYSAFKALPPVLESAMANWKAYSKNLLTHKNPYTGMTLAEDPALIGLCPMNEDPIGTVWHDSQPVTDFFNKLFEEWKSEHGIVTGNHGEEVNAESRFMNEIQNRAEAMYRDYLRNELHVKTPLTGANCLVAISLTEPRSEFDYVDNHTYWDHPRFPGAAWTLPYCYSQMSSIQSVAFVPRTLFPSRIVGKPFTVTEWNYCNPNRFRAEGTALMAAYAGLQDWDGLYRFAHSHNIDNAVKVSPGNGFDMSTDPILQITERIASLMFLRGDVAPAKGMVTYAVDASNAYSVTSSWGAGGFDESSELLGLCTGVGSVWADGMQPDSLSGNVTGSDRFASLPGYVPAGNSLLSTLEDKGVIPAGSADSAAGIYKSDTGQIALDSKDGSFVLSTDRGDWFVSNEAAVLKGANASVELKDGPSSVAMVSLDGKPVSESGHILVMHVTEMFNSEAKFSDKDLKTIQDWGHLPHLMRAGRASLSFASAVPLKAYALDMSGSRAQEVPLLESDGVVSLKMGIYGKSAVIAYELVAR